MLGVFGEERRPAARDDSAPISFVASRGEAEEDNVVPEEEEKPATGGEVEKPAWEKHTKGIGFALLQKMGFKGRLGKEEKGVAAPIEVERRPDGAGLGFGTEKKKKAPANREERQKKRRRFFANAKEMRRALVVAEAANPLEGIESEASELTLARRVLADLEMLVNGEEAALAEARRRFGVEKERGETLRAELAARVDEREELRRREAVLRAFRERVEKGRDDPVALEALASSHAEAWTACGFDVDALGASGAEKRLRALAEAWDPDRDPELPMRLHEAWSRFPQWPDLCVDIFGKRAFEALRTTSDPLSLAVSLARAGALKDELADLLAQRTIAALREPHAPDLMSLLPSPQAKRVADAVVAYLKRGLRAEGVVDETLFSRWRDALPPKHWNPLVAKALPRALARHQPADMLRLARVFGVPERVAAALAIVSAAAAWPRIKRALLRRDPVDAAAVYLDWRDQFDVPPDEAARALLEAVALSLDDPAAFARAPDPPLLSNIDFDSILNTLSPQPKPQHEDHREPAWAASFSASGAVIFTDVVERFAAENDVIFVPKSGRFHDGKQLYNFDGLSIFIDKDLTFAFDPADRSWRPLALEDLLARARANSKK